MTTKITLYHGDCLEVMPTIEKGSVAMVFADLPYGVTSNKWDSVIDLATLWAKQNRLCRKSYTSCFTGVQPFTTTVINSNPRHFKYDLVWVKNRKSAFMSAEKMPLRQHESVLIFADDATYNPQMIQTDAKIITVTNRTKNSKCKNYNSIQTDKLVGPMRYPTSLLIYNRDEIRDGTGHPTQKPVALLEWLVKTYTNPGDLVLDPVSGSATTAIAAIRNGRNVICIEKDRSYFETGVKRVREEIAQSGVDAELVVHG